MSPIRRDPRRRLSTIFQGPATGQPPFLGLRMVPISEIGKPVEVESVVEVVEEMVTSPPVDASQLSPEKSKEYELECDCYSHRVSSRYEDVPDGWISGLTLKAVKTAVLHLLHIVLEKYQKSRCNGCRINHPSQRQHECLEPMAADFYRDNFKRLMRVLYTQNLIPAIQSYLKLYGISLDEFGVGAVTQTILIELKNAGSAQEAINNWYEVVIGEDTDVIDRLMTATRVWESGAEAASQK